MTRNQQLRAWARQCKDWPTDRLYFALESIAMLCATQDQAAQKFKTALTAELHKREQEGRP